MSLQDRIALRVDKLQRKLYDNNIEITGNEIECLRLSIIEENQYGDTTFSLDSVGKITAIINIPGDDVSINSTTIEGVAQTDFFLYDILPIEIQTKFTDDIRGRDILIFRYKDENGVYAPFIFQITRRIAKFQKSLTWSKWLASFYHSPIQPEVKILIDNFLLEDDNEPK